jgi:hypothetical protein
LALGGVFAVDVRHNNAVCALIVGLDLANAKDDRVGGAISSVRVAATFDELAHALVELEGRSWVALDLNCDVAGCICTERFSDKKLMTGEVS